MRFELFLENVSKIEENIDAIQRAIDGKPQAHDFVLLVDVKYILEELKHQRDKKPDPYGSYEREDIVRRRRPENYGKLEWKR